MHEKRPQPAEDHETAHGARRRFDAVLCDIDGCLAPETTAPLDLRALAEVARWNDRAQAEGDRPVVTLCTGRPQPFAEAVCRVIGNRTLPIVCEMGVWLWFAGSNRYERDPRITDEDQRVVDEASRWVERELGATGVVQQPGKTSSMSLYHEDTAYLMSLKPRLVETFAREGWKLRVSSTVRWINCDLAHVSKATGIDRLMQAAGLRAERLAGIGDTMGDLAIRERVAWFGCPSNAEAGLKAQADAVARGAEAMGVLELLERIG